MVASAEQPVGSLYVHVPFCLRKCSYCAFYSEPANAELVERYINALIRELELVAPDLKPRTIYFGGGTPSLLNLRQWQRVFLACERLNLLGAVEWTVECNPATVSLEKAKFLRAAGVNRLSLGIQSLDDSLLRRLGRVHTRKLALQSFDVLRQAGFDNLNLDLMFAIPGQTLQAWRQTLNEVTAMGSEHLSSYEVIYEEDTPLYAQLQAGKADVDEDLACAMYEELAQRATYAGFQQYEVANFARHAFVDRAVRGVWPGGTPGEPAGEDACATLNLPSHACLHNVNYWRGGSFYGLGPSATSYIRGRRAKNGSDTRLYCQQLEQGRSAVESHEELTPVARAGETAAFGLRMVAGWPFEQFRRITGFDLRHEWASEMNQLVRQGWGQVLPDRFQLTPQGLRFADAAAQLFLR